MALCQGHRAQPASRSRSNSVRSNDTTSLRRFPAASKLEPDRGPTLALHRPAPEWPRGAECGPGHAHAQGLVPSRVSAGLGGAGRVAVSLTRWRRSKLTSNVNVALPAFPLSSLLTRWPLCSPAPACWATPGAMAQSRGSVHANHQVPPPFSGLLRAQPEGTAFIHKPGWGWQALGERWRTAWPQPPNQVPPARSPALSPWAEPPGPRLHAVTADRSQVPALGRSLCGSRAGSTTDTARVQGCSLCTNRSLGARVGTRAGPTAPPTPQQPGAPTDHHGGDDGQQCVAEAEHTVRVLDPLGRVLIWRARGGVCLPLERRLRSLGPRHGGA